MATQGSGGRASVPAGARAAGGALGSIAAVAGVLFLLFLVVPLIELYVVIQVGSAIGALNTIVLLVLVGVVGAWLVKREGLSAWHRVRAQLRQGKVPGAELVDGFLILFGGSLMLTPGFLTDALGLALLVPPVRASVRRVLARRFQARALGGRRPEGGSGYLDV
jgi:UPF0716 protein FxsA